MSLSTLRTLESGVPCFFSFLFNPPLHPQIWHMGRNSCYSCWPAHLKYAEEREWPPTGPHSFHFNTSTSVKIIGTGRGLFIKWPKHFLNCIGFMLLEYMKKSATHSSFMRLCWFLTVIGQGRSIQVRTSQLNTFSKLVTHKIRTWHSITKWAVLCLICKLVNSTPRRAWSMNWAGDQYVFLVAQWACEVVKGAPAGNPKSLCFIFLQETTFNGLDLAFHHH